MRKLIVAIVILCIVIGAVVVWLLFAIPREAGALSFPLTSADRALLSRVPASAEAFAFAPGAAVLERRLLENPVSRNSFTTWSTDHSLPHPAILGRADVVLWRRGKVTSFAVRFDPVRAILGRIWLGVMSNADARWDGNLLLVNAPVEPALAPAELEDLLSLAAGFSPSHALVVQRKEARGSFPPIARPSVSTISITPTEILITSRARTAAGDDLPLPARFPQGAMLAATFTNPPKLLGDLNRLLGTRIDELVGSGGSISVYEVDTGTLLPRPDVVIAIPANQASRAAIRDVGRVVDLVGESRDTGSELLVTFDRRSMAKYQSDRFVEATWPAGQWALRIDPVRLIPVLRKLSGSAGLRFASPRIHRAVRDLRRWTDALERATLIEASQTATGGIDELRVRVASK